MARTTKENFKEQLPKLMDRLAELYDSGHTDVSLTWRRSMVEITEPGDQFRNYDAGPTIKIEIILRDPKDRRLETWD